MKPAHKQNLDSKNIFIIIISEFRYFNIGYNILIVIKHYFRNWDKLNYYTCGQMTYL